MGRDAQNIADIRNMADDVARLMADRLGGARRGEHPHLDLMLRRRGGALPGRLRKPARFLAQADRMAAQPKLGRQVDLAAVSRAYQQLTKHLEPLGQISRWRNSTLNFAASVAFGLLVLVGAMIWLAVRSGRL